MSDQEKTKLWLAEILEEDDAPLCVWLEIDQAFMDRLKMAERGLAPLGKEEPEAIMSLPSEAHTSDEMEGRPVVDTRLIIKADDFVWVDVVLGGEVRQTVEAESSDLASLEEFWDSDEVILHSGGDVPLDEFLEEIETENIEWYIAEHRARQLANSAPQPASDDGMVPSEDVDRSSEMAL